MTARQKVRQRVPRSPVKPGRPTAQAIRKAAGGEGQHARDLENALLCHFGYPFEVNPKLYADGSRNMVSMRLAVMAHKDPAAAANVICQEVGAELYCEEQRGERRHWGDNELLSSIYESWTVFGRLLSLRAMEDGAAWHTGQSEAARLLRVDLARTQAVYALLATPGVVRGLNGQKVYSGPVVRAAGMRSLPSRVANPSTTPAASALLGGGTWHREPGPLEVAIAELSDELVSSETSALLSLWDGDIGSGAIVREAWRHGIGYAQRLLAGCRTKHEYLVMIYEDGTKASLLLGEIGASSTAQLRGCIVRGPEAGDVEVLTPHVKERKVPASDAYLRDGVLVAGLASDRHTAGVVTMSLPTAEPVLVVRLGPGHEPEFVQGAGQ